MKNNHKHIIKSVLPDSIADEMNIEVGDTLISINGHKIEDIFDYHYLVNDAEITVLIEKVDGEEWEIEIEKDYDEDLGITFESSLMDNYKSCKNKCIFCFIDQMPKGMRDTLYFKDDDSRLSFLQGNYITLTNMVDKDIERIICYKLAPINISVHTTNKELRCKMLNNRFAGDVLKYIKMLYDAKIPMNGQIVLCKNINDGVELENTIQDLSKYLPYMESVSVVPVGLTKYRDGLTKLESFEKNDAKKVIKTIEKWQDILYKKWQKHFVHASDEWYILAEEDFPTEDTYDGYVQLENGVGMMRLMIDEFYNALENAKPNEKKLKISIATAKLAYSTIKKFAEDITKKFPNIIINVYCIKNNFFGEKITVTGLLTAVDLIEQLKDKDLGERLLISSNVFKADEDVFLDDVTLEDFENALQIKVDIVKSNGYDFLQTILFGNSKENEDNHSKYEL